MITSYPVTEEMRKEVSRRIAGKPVSIFFPEAANMILDGICPLCKRKVVEFRNRLSVREYYTSGMCQNCQDSTFGGE